MSCCSSYKFDEAAPTQTNKNPLSVYDKIQEDELRAASREIEDQLLQTDFVVPDMHCVACITSIEKKLSVLPHVRKARANLSTRRVSVVWDSEQGNGLEAIHALDGLGFSNSLFTGEDQLSDAMDKKGKQLLFALAVAGFAAANIMLLSVSVWSGTDIETTRFFHLISGLIAVPAVAYAGRPFFSSALQALSVKRLNMDVPISLAVLLALGMSIYESINGGEEAYFDAAIMLLFFLLIGRYLDHMMREKARSSVQSLVQLTSKGGVVVEEDESLHYIPQSEIEIGMRLRILPGERFPVDGTIIKGSTSIDRSLVTGESASISANAGDEFEAGVLNLTGSVDINATSDANNSFLAEIMKMMNAAENGRGHYVRIAERMASIYAPAVHLLALVTFIGWMLFSSGDWKTSLYAAIAVLIITCPCALGLAVPVVHVIGANRLFKEGVLMRDGSAFERLAEIDTVVFDKTGTLTEGKAKVVTLRDLKEKEEALIAALANHSSHPLSKAISQKLSQTNLPGLENPVEITGYGVEAEYEGGKIRLGLPQWVAELSGHVPNLNNAITTAFCVEGKPLIEFQIEDDLREDADVASEQLAKKNLNVEILSGDRQTAVAAIAASISIDNFRAGMRPKDKIERLEALRQEGHLALMVGDGLNDAPALTAAHVSMAPSTASEVGRLASDFVFTRPSLLAVPFAHTIAKRTENLIKQNFGLAIAYNCIAVPLAMAGYVTPLLAALAMSASSIVVVANSMRLNFGDGITSASVTAKPAQQLETAVQ
ncbi:MAG: heavy metal translocating P-type ATPase [Rhizobiaceae bacterium]